MQSLQRGKMISMHTSCEQEQITHRLWSSFWLYVSVSFQRTLVSGQGRPKTWSTTALPCPGWIGSLCGSNTRLLLSERFLLSFQTGFMPHQYKLSLLHRKLLVVVIYLSHKMCFQGLMMFVKVCISNGISNGIAIWTPSEFIQQKYQSNLWAFELSTFILLLDSRMETYLAVRFVLDQNLWSIFCKLLCSFFCHL